MNRLSLYICVLLAGIVTSCGPSKEVRQKKELEKLALEVMDAHDRTMADYGKIRPLTKNLLELEVVQTDSIIKKELIDASLALEKADDDMMNWMHNYKAPEDFLPFEEKKAYYLDEKAKIEGIEKQTNRAMDRANLIIEKYGK